MKIGSGVTLLVLEDNVTFALPVANSLTNVVGLEADAPKVLGFFHPYHVFTTPKDQTDDLLQTT